MFVCVPLRVRVHSLRVRVCVYVRVRAGVRASVNARMHALARAGPQRQGSVGGAKYKLSPGGVLRRPLLVLLLVLLVLLVPALLLPPRLLLVLLPLLLLLLLLRFRVLGLQGCMVLRF